MSFQVILTMDNRRRWEWAFTILSLERIVPFYPDMDIPEAIISDPSAVLAQTRQFLKGVRAGYVQGNSASDLPLTSQQSLLDHAFQQIAQTYTSAAAAALYKWCERYVLDDNLSTTLSSWDHLFRRLCGLISDDQSTITTNIGLDSQSKICDAVRTGLLQGYLLNLHQRITEARGQQVTDWEKWLDGYIRLFAGEAYSLGIIDLPLDHVETIARNQRVYHLWETIQSRLTNSERNELFAWGRRQADEIGIQADIRIEFN